MNNSIGKVYLVGAGPGDPGLLTVKGKILIENADVVIYDALVSKEILELVSAKTEIIYGGKRDGRHSLKQEEITQLLIEKARSNAMVVRLKGGDPFIFGRGGEEMEDLLKAGVPVEVVPGVTSGIAAPAYFGIPLTHRGYSSSVSFVTGHEAAGKYRPEINWQAIAQGAETIVIYMGLHNLPNIISQLLAGGLKPDTDIALIRCGTCPEQEILIGTLETITEQMKAREFETPALIIVGAVVHIHSILSESIELAKKLR